MAYDDAVSDALFEQAETIVREQEEERLRVHVVVAAGLCPSCEAPLSNERSVGLQIPTWERDCPTCGARYRRAYWPDRDLWHRLKPAPPPAPSFLRRIARLLPGTR